MSSGKNKPASCLEVGYEIELTTKHLSNYTAVNTPYRTGTEYALSSTLEMLEERLTPGSGGFTWRKW